MMGYNIVSQPSTAHVWLVSNIFTLVLIVISASIHAENDSVHVECIYHFDVGPFSQSLHSVSGKSTVFQIAREIRIVTFLTPFRTIINIIFIKYLNGLYTQPHTSWCNCATARIIISFNNSVKSLNV